MLVIKNRKQRPVGNGEMPLGLIVDIELFPDVTLDLDEIVARSVDL
jgi:hypothetical protein